MTFTVVIAPDSFKGSIDAASVARAIADGWASVRPDDRLTLFPQADGGEGTLDAIAAAVGRSRIRSAGSVTGPDGRPIEGRWLELPDGTAVVELAQMSGLPLMAEPDPLGATTRGLGEVIAAALDAGARRLVIGLGGSASTDGGAGALSALGLRMLDSDDRPLGDGGVELARIDHLDRSALRAPPAGGIRLMSDVTAPLLGPSGAAAVFGPQKGATPADIATLESALGRFAVLLGGDPGTPGAGAAGGTGFGFLAAWAAGVESGSVAIAELTGFAAAAASADVVITGEGRFDGTSLTGKVVGNALALSDRGPAIPVIIAGSVAAEPVTPSGHRGIAVALVDLAGGLEPALADPARWIRDAAALAADGIRDSPNENDEVDVVKQ